MQTQIDKLIIEIESLELRLDRELSQSTAKKITREIQKKNKQLQKLNKKMEKVS